MESYVRAYEYILKFGMLYELEAFGDDLQKPGYIENTVAAWDSRIKVTMPLGSVREPILHLRRVLLQSFGYFLILKVSRNSKCLNYFVELRCLVKAV
jgi:hypothetical protein